ncbi:MAG TPA: PAS domain-containing protein [Hyalangium sp.]|nr:PAS domain-containing protein [Hyalangium sp.]
MLSSALPLGNRPWLPSLANPPKRQQSRRKPDALGGLSNPDYIRIFDAVPHAYLVLSPDLRIVGANTAYLQSTLTRRERILGRHMFDVFPDNPADRLASGVTNLSASFKSVLAERRPHRMTLQRYDIRQPDGTFIERYWSPFNAPVLDQHNRVHLIIHHVQDVTTTVLGEVDSMDHCDKALQETKLQLLNTSRHLLGPTRRLIEETRDIISQSRKRSRKLLTKA